MMNNLLNYEKIKKILSQRLTQKRYIHSLAVADEALRLAKAHGVDCEKAYLCGLLHDITKNSSREEHLNIFSEFDIMLNDIEIRSHKLWHAISGSAYVRYILKIDDEEIYDAIRYHTTAKPNLSLLSKILYLADFTSADRDYPDVDVMRKLVDESLDKAYAYALSYTVKELAQKGAAVHLDTILAYNEVVLKGSSV